VRVGTALGGKFPPEALPAHMLPRDLAKLQSHFPTAPTSILQVPSFGSGSLQVPSFGSGSEAEGGVSYLWRMGDRCGNGMCRKWARV
jgi:hypothetical protein